MSRRDRATILPPSFDERAGIAYESQIDIYVTAEDIERCAAALRDGSHGCADEGDRETMPESERVTLVPGGAS